MSESIIQIINKHLGSNETEVPVFHAVAIKLQQVLEEPDFNIEQVSQLITADSGLASQVLRIANSAYYTGLSKIATIQDAVIRLGAREVASIAMVATQHDFYYSANPHFNSLMQTLWNHAFCSAAASKWLAEKCGFRQLSAEAFLAGLLHDIGKLFLLKVVEEMQASGSTGITFSPALLLEVLNSMHVSHGTALMEKWNMPEVYCAVVREHHAEPWHTNDPILAMVRLADRTCNKGGIGLRPDPDQMLFATAEAQILGMKEITLAELEIFIEDTLAQAVPCPA